MKMKTYLTIILLIGSILLTIGSSIVSQAQIVEISPVSNSYTEDFATYTYKAYTDDSVWDIWQGHVRLARRDAKAQYDPDVAYDSEGNLLVVWTDSRNGNGNADGNADIFAQKIDGNGNKLWVDDIQVNDDSTIANQQNPAIASDTDGNLLLVWSDSRNGNWDIYAQRVGPDGTKVWGNDIRVNSDIGSTTQRLPAIASDDDGNLLIVWQDYRNGNSDIYAQKLNGDGSKVWVNDVLVNSDVGDEDQISPTVASDGSGNLLVVWQDHRNGNSDIYTQKLSEAGNKVWTNDIRVNSDDGDDDQISPAVASDDNGNLLIVWQDFRNSNSDIYAQKLNEAGNKVWASDIRVNSDGGTANQRTPAVDNNSNGSIVVVWQDYRNGSSNPDIYSQQLDNSGNKVWTDDVRINNDNGTANQASPVIVGNASNNMFVVWQDYRNSDSDIYAQKIDSNGSNLWMSDVRVNHDSGAANQMVPGVVGDGNGNMLLVWEDYRNGSGDIYAQKFDSNGGRLWLEDVRVNIHRDDSHRTSPDVAIDQLGNLLVVWSDSRNGNPLLYAQKLGTNGDHIWSNDVLVSSDGGGAWQLTSAIASNSSGDLLLVWADNRSGNWDIYAQKLDGGGNRSWFEDVRVNSNVDTTSQTSPDIASDSDGNLLVIWRDGRNGKSDFYAQKLDGNGNKTWVADVLVNSDGGIAWQPPPAIARDNDDNLLLVWSDDRNGNNNIYAQKMDGSGNKLWANDVRVNSNSNTTSQSFPDLASDGNGNLLVVWQDYRNGDADVYAQKLDGNGNKLWANDVRVNSDAGSAWQATPSVAADGNNLLINWRDYRNGNNDIYIQRLDGNGSKLWLEDMQVVYPDVFYLPLGLVESHTVNTTGANIAYAEFTVMAELNAGDVQYHLTNNGGQDWIVVTPGIIHIFATMGSDLRWRMTLTAASDITQSPIVDSLIIAYGSVVPPTNLTASAVSSSEINLDWVDNSDNEVGFKIERSLDGSSGWIEIDTVSVNVTSYQDNDLDCDTTYNYRVRAYSLDGDSAYSNVASATTEVCTPDVNDWLFLAYLACDNDIGPYCVQAFSRLEQASINPFLQVVVLWDKPGLNNTYRYLVQPDGQYVDGVNRWYLGELDTADPQTLATFVSWGLDNYPATHSYLSIIGHGMGHMGVAWDYQTDPNHQAYMRPNQVRAALEQATLFGERPLDILHFDACSMGLLEQAYQYKEYANILIASQGITWTSFPYHQYGTLFAPSVIAHDIAAGVVDIYASSVSQYPHTISAIDLHYVEDVAAATDHLAQVLQAAMPVHHTQIRNARTATQKFHSAHPYQRPINNHDAHLDLYDFAEQTIAFVSNTNVQAAANQLKQAIGEPGDSFIIAESHQSGHVRDSYQVEHYWAFDRVGGVSIYFPVNGPGWPDYMNHQFRFTSETSWTQFLLAYFDLLGLPPQPVEPPIPPPVFAPDSYLFLPLVVR